MTGKETGREIFERKLEKFRYYLGILARKHLGPTPLAGCDASDVVQETLLRAHRKIDQFKGEDSAQLAGWLRTTLARLIAERRGLKGLGQVLSLEAALEQSSMNLAMILEDKRQSTPSSAARATERVLLVADALASLPETQRQAVLLRHVEGIPRSKIAKELGVHVGTIDRRIVAGLKALQQRLSDAES